MYLVMYFYKRMYTLDGPFYNLSDTFEKVI